MLNVVLLLLNFFVSLYFIKKRSTALLGYLIFFQEVHLIPFAELGMEILGYIYYIILVILYFIYITRLKISIKWLKYILNDKVIWALIFITIAMIIHVIIGIQSNNEKTIIVRYFFQVVPALIFLILVLGNNLKVEELQKGIMLYGSFLFLILILNTDILNIAYLARGQIREEAFISPIAISRIGGVLFITSFFSFFNNNALQYKNLIFSLIVIFISLIMIVLGMSRGPLVSLFIALIIYIIYIPCKNIKIFYKVAFLLVPILFVAGYIICNYEISFVNIYIDRLKELQNFQDIGRYRRYELFVSYIITDMNIFSYEFIWGWGPDGFNKVYGLGYVHNLIMEAIFEYGLIGLAFIVLFTFSSFRNSYQIMKSKIPHHYLFIPINFIMLYMTSMFSGDIIASRNVLFIAIIQVSLVYILNRSIWQLKY